MKKILIALVVLYAVTLLGAGGTLAYIHYAEENKPKTDLTVLHELLEDVGPLYGNVDTEYGNNDFSWVRGTGVTIMGDNTELIAIYTSEKRILIIELDIEKRPLTDKVNLSDMYIAYVDTNTNTYLEANLYEYDVFYRSDMTTEQWGDYLSAITLQQWYSAIYEVVYEN